MQPDADSVAKIARVSAERLASQHQGLVPAVERALVARDTETPPGQFFDPISLGALIVAAATLAWQVYNDHKGRSSSPPSHDVVARTVRVQLETPTDANPVTTRQIIDVVVTETMNTDQPDT